MGEAQHYNPAAEQNVDTSGTDMDKPKDTVLAAEPRLDSPDERHKPDDMDLINWAMVRASRGSEAMSPESIFGKHDSTNQEDKL